jgi:Chaperone of endosialidase
MPLTAGAPVNASALEDLTFTIITISPTPSAAAQHLVFNHGYSIYADNTGTGAAASRLWIDAPDGSDIIIGPRSGSSFTTTLRLRTNATTASAANCFIDSSTQQIRRSTSSLRYKTDVHDAEFDTAAWLALRPVVFRDRNEVNEYGIEGSRQYLGLIAEEVDALGLSHLVQYDGNGDPDSVQYDRITVGLLALVREQAAQIAALTQRVEALESA